MFNSILCNYISGLYFNSVGMKDLFFQINFRGRISIFLSYPGRHSFVVCPELTIFRPYWAEFPTQYLSSNYSSIFSILYSE
jgi:hypothetical protein